MTSDFCFPEFLLGYITASIIGLIIVILVIGSGDVVDVPKFGTALCESHGYLFQNYTNKEVLRINCIENVTKTQSLDDGVVVLIKREG